MENFINCTALWLHDRKTEILTSKWMWQPITKWVVSWTLENFISCVYVKIIEQSCRSTQYDKSQCVTFPFTKLLHTKSKKFINDKNLKEMKPSMFLIGLYTIMSKTPHQCTQVYCTPLVKEHGTTYKLAKNIQDVICFGVVVINTHHPSHGGWGALLTLSLENAVKSAVQSCVSECS